MARRVEELTSICRDIYKRAELPETSLGIPLVDQPVREYTFIQAAITYYAERHFPAQGLPAFLAALALPALVNVVARLKEPWPEIPPRIIRGRKCGARDLLETALVYEDAAWLDQMQRDFPRAPREDPQFACGVLWQASGLPRDLPVAWPLSWYERFNPPPGKHTPFQWALPLGYWLPPLQGSSRRQYQRRGLSSRWELSVLERHDVPPTAGVAPSGVGELSLRRMSDPSPLRIPLSGDRVATLLLGMTQAPLKARGGIANQAAPVRAVSFYVCQPHHNHEELLHNAGYAHTDLAALPGRPPSVYLCPNGSVEQLEVNVPAAHLVGPGGGHAPFHGWETLPLGTPPSVTALLLAIGLARAAMANPYYPEPRDDQVRHALKPLRLKAGAGAAELSEREQAQVIAALRKFITDVAPDEVDAKMLGESLQDQDRLREGAKVDATLLTNAKIRTRLADRLVRLFWGASHALGLVRYLLKWIDEHLPSLRDELALRDARKREVSIDNPAVGCDVRDDLSSSIRDFDAAPPWAGHAEQDEADEADDDAERRMELDQLARIAPRSLGVVDERVNQNVIRRRKA